LVHLSITNNNSSITDHLSKLDIVMVRYIAFVQNRTTCINIKISRFMEVTNQMNQSISGIINTLNYNNYNYNFYDYNIQLTMIIQTIISLSLTYNKLTRNIISWTDCIIQKVQCPTVNLYSNFWYNYTYYKSSNIIIQLYLCYLNNSYFNNSWTMFLTTIGISSFINKLTIILISHNNTTIEIEMFISHVILRVFVYESPYIFNINIIWWIKVNSSISFLVLLLILGISLDHNKDSIKESIPSLDIVSYQMLCLVSLFILSENIVILSNFWSYISASYSSSTTTYNQTIQDLLTQITNELTSTNTILLSNWSLSLGHIFQINNTHLLRYFVTIVSSILICHLFINCQIKEYQYVSLLMNESLNTSEFFIFIGIHLCHVIIGSLLITIYLWETSLIRTEVNFTMYLLKLSLCSYQHQYHLLITLLLIYWHFVEGLWILISWNLYN